MTQNNKHPAMIVYEDAHLNAEPPLDLLCSSFITPTELFFARNHAPIPTLDPTTYRLNINGLVQKSLTLTLEDVMRYPKQVITATLMCAGNRRLALHQREPIKDELPWDNSAISTATWGGLWLRDLLMEAGLEDGAAHIAFLGADEVPKGESSFHFGGSVPLEKMEDVLLAYEMNGEPLRSEHGYPLRVIAPGTIGARSVKISQDEFTLWEDLKKLSSGNAAPTSDDGAHGADSADGGAPTAPTYAGGVGERERTFSGGVGAEQPASETLDELP